jgi:type I restriction enzyme R subunit
MRALASATVGLVGVAAEIKSTVPHNRRFHQLLVGGVPVEYQRNGETRGDFVRLLDWANPAANEWLAVNQFAIKGPHHTRRPDVMLFVNGLPLVLLELKNPADQNADIWKAYDQIQTYKAQIPDVFRLRLLSWWR